MVDQLLKVTFCPKCCKINIFAEQTQNSDRTAARNSVAFCDKYLQGKERFSESCDITGANIA